jgi:hypothetical protein
VLHESKIVLRTIPGGLAIDSVSADACGPWRLMWFSGQKLGRL